MINWDMMITPESLKAAAARDEAMAYLANTDWYVIRSLDPSDGKSIPPEVVEKRQAARAVLDG